MTNNLQSEIDDHMTSGSQVISMGQSGGMEEDADVPEPDEAEVPGSNNLVVMRQNRVNTSRTLQKRSLQKNMALLPPVGHNSKNISSFNITVISQQFLEMPY